MVVNNYERALSALNHLDSGCSYDEWFRIGAAAKAEGLTFNDFHEWSRRGQNYKNESDCRTMWESIKPGGGINAGTLFWYAKNAGWIDDKSKNFQKTEINFGHDVPPPIPNEYYDNIEYSEFVSPSSIDKSEKILSAEEVWSRCIAASADYQYIARKGGSAIGLRVYPLESPPITYVNKSGKLCTQNVCGYLAVPCYENEKLQTIQFIPPHDGDKLNLGGCRFKNGYFAIGDETDTKYLCEGIGQAWAAHTATGQCAIVCFGIGRMLTVAKTLRAKYPDSQLVVIPDSGKEDEASKIAETINGRFIKLPQDKPKNYDINDYLLEHKENALRELLARPVIELPLDVEFADELSEDFEAPDEIVEGVLTAGDGSILYGDSNCGKTYFVVDMACSIARGTNWMDKHTEKGMVVYLAAESPSSIKRRLQAYQQHHKVRVPNFAIVKNPINLFDGDADTNKIINLVQILEKQRGEKVRFVVGDTLARLSAGANESAGQDMGVVIKHFDRIRNDCKAHFMLIHHSGKNAAAGARGWSGVRAAVETEIEITATAVERCAEITKQRDLGTKGVRIGFGLEQIELGKTKWGAPATSCVVIPAEASIKKVNKRKGKIAPSILEYLRLNKCGVEKAALAKHFVGKVKSLGSVYRVLANLVKQGEVIDADGVVKIVVPTSAK